MKVHGLQKLGRDVSHTAQKTVLDIRSHPPISFRGQALAIVDHRSKVLHPVRKQKEVLVLGTRPSAHCTLAYRKVKAAECLALRSG
jgi:hypothetical protein